MKYLFQYSAVLFCLLSLAPFASAQGDPGQPDAVREQVSQAVREIGSQGSREAASNAMQRVLKGWSDPEREPGLGVYVAELVIQVAEDHGNDQRMQAIGVALLGQAAQSVPPRAVLKHLDPLIVLNPSDGDETSSLARQVALELLSANVDDQPADMIEYFTEPFKVGSSPTRLGNVLVLAMQKEPHLCLDQVSALLLNDEHLDRRELMWSRHAVSHATWALRAGFQDRVDLAPATAELIELAQSPYWWARLYAGIVMTQHTELMIPATFDKLKEDQDQLVKRLALSFEK